MCGKSLTTLFRRLLFVEKIDNIIRYIGEKSKSDNASVRLTSLDYPIAFAKDGCKIAYLIEKAIKLKFLEKPPGTGYSYRLDVEGWSRLSEKRRKQILSKQAFVAMWFNDITTQCRAAVRAGVSAAGYTPVIVDESEFAGDIMDFILDRIGESKFVIADFTTPPEERVELMKNCEKTCQRIKNGTRGGV